MQLHIKEVPSQARSENLNESHKSQARHIVHTLHLNEAEALSSLSTQPPSSRFFRDMLQHRCFASERCCFLHALALTASQSSQLVVARAGSATPTDVLLLCHNGNQALKDFTVPRSRAPQAQCDSEILRRHTKAQCRFGLTFDCGSLLSYVVLCCPHITHLFQHRQTAHLSMHQYHSLV